MRLHRTCLAALAAAGATLAFAPGAAHATDDGTVHPMLLCSDSKNGLDSVSRTQAIARGKVWVDHHIKYSETTCHTDKNLGTYREDCSGFVSMAWGLKESMTTVTLPTVADMIKKSDMRPGDAFIDKADHAAMFVRWADSAHDKVVIYEESGRKQPDGSIVPTIELTTSLDYWKEFDAYRYKHITEDSEVAGSGWAAVSPGGNLHVGAVVNGKAYHNYRPGKDDSTKWNGWTDLGGTNLTGTPALMAVNDAYQFFAINTDGKLQHSIYNPDTKKWGDWTTPALPNGDPITFKPDTGLTAIHVNGHTHVFGITKDNTLYHVWYDGKKWNPTTLDGNIAGTPAVIYHDNTYNVYALDPAGELFSRRFDNGKWLDWTDHTTNGKRITFKPGTGISAVYANNHQHILGINPDGTPQHDWYDGKTWHLTTLTGTATNTPALDYTTNGYDAYAINNNHDYNIKTNTHNTWGPWTDFGHP